MIVTVVGVMPSVQPKFGPVKRVDPRSCAAVMEVLVAWRRYEHAIVVRTFDMRHLSLDDPSIECYTVHDTFLQCVSNVYFGSGVCLLVVCAIAVLCHNLEI
jgi:hypothetical protein